MGAHKNVKAAGEYEDRKLSEMMRVAVCDKVWEIEK